jgi:hypothetical protein
MPTQEISATAITQTSRVENTLQTSELLRQKNRLERAQHGWETAMSVALAVTAIAALLVFIFDTSIRRTSKRIQETQDQIIHDKEIETAEAQEKAADAQLKLDQWLAKKVIARFAEPIDFEPLKRFHNIEVEVFYKEGDGEAFMYAQSILQNLNSLGWKVPKISTPTRNHPVVGNVGNPIIGTFVLAKHVPHGAEVFNQLRLPVSEKSLTALLAGAVKGGLLENSSIPENHFIIVVGEYLRDWNR